MFMSKFEKYTSWYSMRNYDTYYLWLHVVTVPKNSASRFQSTVSVCKRHLCFFSQLIKQERNKFRVPFSFLNGNFVDNLRNSFCGRNQQNSIFNYLTLPNKFGG